MKVDYQQEVIARSHDIPVVAQFSADWCGPCRVMKPMIKMVHENRKDFGLVVIDVDHNPEPSIENGIRGIPTVLMFKGGQKVGKYSGGFSSEHFNNWVDSFLNT